MSDAQVEFHLVDEHRHWARDRQPVPQGKEQAFSFACPKHERRCGDLVIAGRTILRRGSRGEGAVPMWDWDGSTTAPTFTPSVNCVGCWHGFIRAGRCVDVQGRDEP